MNQGCLFEENNHFRKSTQKRSACEGRNDKKISENHEVYIKTRKKWDFFYRNVKIIKKLYCKLDCYL